MSKFGKYNSGMDAKEVMRWYRDWRPKNPNASDSEFIIRMCERFSQQPPKERKVSLEEIINSLKYTLEKFDSIHTKIERQSYSFVMANDIRRVLSLLNATEGQ